MIERVIAAEAASTNLILFVWLNGVLKQRSTALDSSMLTIAPPGGRLMCNVLVCIYIVYTLQ
jgi:hypothetical protein